MQHAVSGIVFPVLAQINAPKGVSFVKDKDEISFNVYHHTGRSCPGGGGSHTRTQVASITVNGDSFNTECTSSWFQAVVACGSSLVDAIDALQLLQLLQLVCIVKKAAMREQANSDAVARYTEVQRDRVAALQAALAVIS